MSSPKYSAVAQSAYSVDKRCLQWFCSKLNITLQSLEAAYPSALVSAILALPV